MEPICYILCPKKSKQRELLCLLLQPAPDAWQTPKKKPDALCSNPNAICLPREYGCIHFGPSFADVVGHSSCASAVAAEYLWFACCCGVRHKLRHCSLFLSRHRLLRPLLRLHRLPLAPSPFIFPLTQVRLGTLGDAATADCVSYTLLSSAFLAQAPALRPPRDASVSSLPLILLPA